MVLLRPYAPLEANRTKRIPYFILVGRGWIRSLPLYMHSRHKGWPFCNNGSSSWSKSLINVHGIFFFLEGGWLSLINVSYHSYDRCKSLSMHKQFFSAHAWLLHQLECRQESTLTYTCFHPSLALFSTCSFKPPSTAFVLAFVLALQQRPKMSGNTITQNKMMKKKPVDCRKRWLCSTSILIY